jgi:uncharacterized membrane-anchored protein YitT (DUF2179 family)
LTSKARVRRELVNAALIGAGVMSAAMGLKGFLLSSNFIDGGVTGVSMLVAKATRVPLAMLLPAINLPFVAIGLHQMGLAFAIRSALSIAALAGVLAVVPFPDVTPDLVLTAVFGGFFIGAGIGLAIRGGAVLDGTEIAALLISKRADLLRVGDVILGFNVLLFLAAIALLGVDAALYSILTYVAAARTLDFVLHGIDAYMAVTIVSDLSARIRERLTHDLGRGVTIYKGSGGMTGAEQDILYCVITRLEIARVKGIVRDIDPGAFVVYHALSGAQGGVMKTRGFH